MALYVFTYTEFLDNFGLENKLQELNSFLRSPTIKLIGQGALGQVYSKNDLVVKVTNLCGFGPTSLHCQLVNEKGLIYSFNQTYGGISVNYYIVPDFIMELLITKLFMEMGKLIVGTPLYLGVGYNFASSGPSILIEMKKYEKMEFASQVVEVELAFKIFQIMVSIFLLQYHIRFTHYDLHWGNIMSSDEDRKTIRLTDTVAFNFPEMKWPVIVDYGTSVFSIGNNMNGRDQFLNSTNNLHHPELWQEFNPFFDGLTLIKSLELKNIRIFDGQFSKIIKCFFKTDNPLSFYVSTNSLFYRPDIKKINDNSKNLFNPIEVLANLFNTFGNERPFNLVNFEYKGATEFGVTSKYWPIPRLDPILKPGEIDLPKLDIQKIYYLSSKLPPLKIKTIFPALKEEVFSFSLFVGSKYFTASYMYMCDPNYILSIGDGKSGDDAFYRYYLGKQLDECFSLITNSDIKINSPGWGLNQWQNFGTMILLDKYAMDLPMMINQNNMMIPWIKKQGIQFDRKKISQDCMAGLSPLDIMKKYNWGTVRDYIKDKAFRELDKNQRSRFAIFEYELPPSMIEDITVYKNIKYPNGAGFIGSIVRFLPLQDPSFSTLLFRDAHSTIPNRNYTYDRDWYDTWMTKSGKKLWFYHGAFYNPPHGEGMKITFAATWGARKLYPTSGPILSPQQYEDIFGFSNIVPDHYFGKISYGIDERLMYRITTQPIFQNETYFVGMTHLVYLVIGQENPRNFKIFQALPRGTALSPDALKGIKDPDLINLDNQNYICRKLDFIMPDHSFYTDMRCVFLASMGQVEKDYGGRLITGNEYFKWLEQELKTPDKIGCAALWKMLPPRWNIWQYLFGHDHLDNEQLVPYLKSFVNLLGDSLNLDTICKINRYLWVGNQFNFDEAFRGNQKYLPNVIVLPDNYPVPP